jgi:hypothetical protein
MEVDPAIKIESYVEHQCRHSRQKDTKLLQEIAFRAREYGTRRVFATEPLGPGKL